MVLHLEPAFQARKGWRSLNAATSPRILRPQVPGIGQLALIPAKRQPRGRASALFLRLVSSWPRFDTLPL